MGGYHNSSERGFDPRCPGAAPGPPAKRSKKWKQRNVVNVEENCLYQVFHGEIKAKELIDLIVKNVILII